jgi:hypothetical protein
MGGETEGMRGFLEELNTRLDEVRSGMAIRRGGRVGFGGVSIVGASGGAREGRATAAASHRQFSSRHTRLACGRLRLGPVPPPRQYLALSYSRKTNMANS